MVIPITNRSYIVRFSLVFNVLLVIVAPATENSYHCDKSAYDDCDDRPLVSHFDARHTDAETQSIAEPDIFLLYDVNSSEGFNLRRDVYIRMAVFLNILQKHDGYGRATLVLPPFHRLYHWRSRDRNDDVLFWNHFFDLNSLKAFANVIDFWEYFDRIKQLEADNADWKRDGQMMTIDHAVQLKHFASMFDSGKFEDKYEFGRCSDDERRRQHESFHNIYNNFTIDHFHCVEFQGSASLLYDVLEELPRT